jgi:type IV fimbrial biogenesis protein FimT
MPGFTLVELMVTIFVAGVLLAVAVPSFNRMMVTSRVTAQANELVAAINFARSEAIKRNTSMVLCRARAADSADCAGNPAGIWQFWIVKPDSGGQVARRGVINEFSNALAVRSSLTADRVVFGPDGLARTGGALIEEERINVCSTRSTDRETRRRIVLGVGSRLNTETFEGNC